MHETQNDQRALKGALIRESYFPTLIYYVDLPNGPQINATIKPEIYSWRVQAPDGIVRSNVKQMGAWHSTTDLADREEMKALNEAIIETAASVFANVGYDPAYVPRISNIWANINPRHAYNKTHTHPNALWSGVYYVQTPENCGRLVFRDPRAQAQALLPFYPEGPRRQEVWTEVFFEAIEGRIILFPAWLQHEVEPNMSTRDSPAGDRISISFNLRQER